MGNGNGGEITFKKWQIGVGALLTAALWIFTIVFRAGSIDTKTNMRLDAIEKHLDYDDSVFVRKDGAFAVIEQRLSFLEAQESRIENEQQEQTQQLERLLAGERR